MTQEQWKKRNFKPTQLSHHHYWEKTEITDKEFWLKAFWCEKNVTEHSWADKALDYWEAKEPK